MTLSPARRAAFAILRQVEQDGAFASALLAGLDQSMRDEDRSLCHELVLGVLRRQLWLDRALEHFANRPMEDLDLPVRVALRLGLYQLRFLSRIPPSAAVNESVNLVHAAKLRSAGGFVNAVLRRATREPDYDPATNARDALEKLAIETSHPHWLIERWSKTFGLEETAAFARANNDPAPVVFRFTAKVESPDGGQRIIDDLTAAGAELSPSGVAPESWRVNGAGKVLRKLSQDGLIYFQDEASQLVAHLLSAQRGERVLDVCAAPGSKSTLIASLVPGAVIFAGDLHEHRLQTLAELAARQGLSTFDLVAYDAVRGLPFADASFDRVLVDAPCSGTGTLRHNPEIRWRIGPGDIAELSQKQKRILKNSAAMVRTGGRLVYSTCSVEPEENEAVVETFLKEHADFVRLRFSRSSDLETSTGALRTWPHRQDVDGFFVAAFERS